MIESARRLKITADVLAVAALLALWMLFFWRLLTPIEADQASLKLGDFSGQFVAFGGYQYTRWSNGQVPLWNPYNNGGLPFIADPQAAVFYPPRLLTIALAKMSGGWSYHALELEMAAHVLFYSLLIYALVRRMTTAQSGSHLAGLTAAITGSYGGFITGYPPLQLAILEALTWIPAGLLGVHLATEARDLPRPRYAWLILTAAAYGLSWMAGHPQTTFFMTYLMTAYLAYRIYARRWRWQHFLSGATLIGVLGAALAAVHLLPGLEYLRLTTRAGFGFDAKGNGFPLQDITQFIFPNVVSLYSPLYIGLTALSLALIALWKRAANTGFWGAAALLALLWSFGANSLVYPALYYILPGLNPFRGQERAALIVSLALALLAGLGIAQIAAGLTDDERTKLSRALRRAATAIIAVAAIIFALWLGFRQLYDDLIGYIVFSAFIAGGLSLLLPIVAAARQRWTLYVLPALIIVELFTVNMDAIGVYDHVPPTRQVSMTAPAWMTAVTADEQPFRVDGFRGLTDNYGSLYQIADVRGISPLWLASAHAIIEAANPNPRAWEVFAVRYVFTDWNELPVPSTIIARGDDRYGPVNLHRLQDERPFALLMSDFEIMPDDEAAQARLFDSGFDPRRTIILDRDPGLIGPEEISGAAQITTAEPEQIVIEVTSQYPAILSLAQLDYPGWYATVNDDPISILRAYGALTAVTVPSGESIVRLRYDPLSYRLGALISLAAWSGCGTALLIFGIRRLQRIV